MSLHLDHATAPEEYFSAGQKFACGHTASANNMRSGAIGYLSMVRDAGLVMYRVRVEILQAPQRFSNASNY